VRAGVSRISPDPRRVPRCLSEAMLALDWATHSGQSTVYYEEEAAKREKSGPFMFRALPALVRSVAHIDKDGARVAVEQLVGEIVWHSGANLEVARAHVTALYSQAAIAGAELSLVEPRVMSDLAAAFGERTTTAGGLDALGAIFQEHVLLLVDALARPEKAGQKAKLERIMRFIDLHLEEPLTRAGLARLAGYAPAYLSRLFRRIRNVSLEQHILGRRLERAKELLRSTDLDVVHVAASSGFPSAAYFHRAFKSKVGTTPDGFRAKTREVSQ
jgi:AraC-like DNA-binding protein